MIEIAVNSIRYGDFAGFGGFYSFPTRGKREPSIFGKNI
jgi:hypothetical protein